MRGMIIAALASLAIPLAFFSPFLGLLAYCWLSYMRPVDMAWGSISHITFGLYTAVAIFAGLLFRLRFQFFRWSPITWILFVYWAWWGVCTWFAMDRGLAMDGLVQISRIFVICLVTTGLCTTKDRLKWVLVATAGSLLFHGTKLGLLGVATGGSRNVNPIGGLMSGNNENAIALTMALPFAVHFALNEAKAWKRAALWCVAALTVVAIVCTYSRGGFLGLAAAGCVLVWHSRARWFGVFVALPVLAIAGFAFAPQEWKDRIGGIDDAAKTDDSAKFRLMAWRVAADITLEHPIAGIGPENFYSQSKKFPRPSSMHDMEIHNTYLEMSSGIGITGLATYLVLVGAVWVTLSRARRDARERADPRFRWFDTAATATQASITAFLVSSTFGSLANFELMYHVCILGACLPVALRHEATKAEDEALAAAGIATGPAPEPAAPAAVPAVSLSRYDRRPELVSPAPAGLPDFRTAAPAAPVVPPTAPVAAAPETPAHTATQSAHTATQSAHAAPRRHTERSAEPVDESPEASHTQLAAVFVDPFGTVGPDEPAGPRRAAKDADEDLFVDTATGLYSEPLPPKRASDADERRLAAAPWLSRFESKALSRPAQRR